MFTIGVQLHMCTWQCKHELCLQCELLSVQLFNCSWQMWFIYPLIRFFLILMGTELTWGTFQTCFDWWYCCQVVWCCKAEKYEDLKSSLNSTIMSDGHLVSSKTYAGSTGNQALFPESQVACCHPWNLRVSRKWNCTGDLKHSTSRICSRRPIID